MCVYIQQSIDQEQPTDYIFSTSLQLLPVYLMDGLIVVLLATVAILFSVQKAFGINHTVQGWELTAANVSSDTRSKMMFSVGDGLVFKMGGGEADIAQVSKSDYEICKAKAPKATYRASTTEAIYLNKTGNWYFISRVPEHCKSGKKLMITVVATYSNKSNNEAGFRFREAFQRMMGVVNHRGGGSGVSGGGSSGGGGTPATTNPLGNRNRVLPKKNGSSSTQELSAMFFKFQLVMAVFCSVLLANPLFV